MKYNNQRIIQAQRRRELVISEVHRWAKNAEGALRVDPADIPGTLANFMKERGIHGKER